VRGSERGLDRLGLPKQGTVLGIDVDHKLRQLVDVLLPSGDFGSNLSAVDAGIASWQRTSPDDRSGLLVIIVRADGGESSNGLTDLDAGGGKGSFLTPLLTGQSVIRLCGIELGNGLQYPAHTIAFFYCRRADDIQEGA